MKLELDKKNQIAHVIVEKDDSPFPLVEYDVEHSEGDMRVRPFAHERVPVKEFLAKLRPFLRELGLALEYMIR